MSPKRIVVSTMADLMQARKDKAYSIWVKGPLAARVKRMKRRQMVLWLLSVTLLAMSVGLFFLLEVVMESNALKGVETRTIYGVTGSLVFLSFMGGLGCAVAASLNRLRKYRIISYSRGLAHLQRTIL